MSNSPSSNLLGNEIVRLKSLSKTTPSVLFRKLVFMLLVSFAFGLLFLGEEEISNLQRFSNVSSVLKNVLSSSHNLEILLRVFFLFMCFWTRYPLSLFLFGISFILYPSVSVFILFGVVVQVGLKSLTEL